ncbi:MAG: FAD/NAD(P)-binding protein [Candidatus Binatia bacterium]
MTAPLTPAVVEVRRFRRETRDTFTLTLAPHGDGFVPGQFNMLHGFGVGESAISISGDPAARDVLVHTIRAVGPTTVALSRLRRGDVVGVRGPFGTGWPLESARGADVVVLAGGIGLAPLRPALYQLVADRAAYGRVVLCYGARSPGDLLYRAELERWRRRGVEVLVAVDRADTTWRGQVGPVTRLLDQATFAPARTTAMICGPEVMTRLALRALADGGVSEERLWVSLERTMQCGVGTCGHCQLGPHFVCLDGPVFSYAGVKPFFTVAEA